MCPPTAFVCAILAALFAVSSSNNCKTLQIQANGALKSGTYTIQNSAGQSYRIYCQFYDGYGYTFLSTSTNVNVDMSSLYDDKSHVIIRHKRSNGIQYTSIMAQLGSFASNPVSVQYSGHSGYQGPQNTAMAPYIFVGFIPQSLTYKGALQGWKVNDEELTFENCDGNPNSYITFFFNPSGQGYTDYVGGHNTLLYQWYDGASAVAQSENLPDEFFANYHEVHQGGCGGYSRGSNVPTGGAVGMKFTVECAVPANVNGAQMTYAGTNIGHTAKYTCLSGYQHTGGDLSRTCSGSGAWSGATPVCGNINDCAPNPCQNGGQCTDGLNAYTCACASGFRGTVCETNINECDPNPCLNGAKCIDGINAFTCSCLAGYNGQKCESNINECDPNPCQNGGECTDGINDYVCACVAGFNGKSCQININECDPNPCNNGAQCIDGINAFTCACVAGYNGKTCEININECDPSPCTNGGKCSDGINDYQCACPAGYEGKSCEININECQPNPCQNGGKCTDEVNYFTCACVAGYAGKRCDININECDPNPCLNGGKCSDGINDYTCACVAGYEGKNCDININECDPNPCQNGGKCSDGINDYQCACVAGYDGKKCEININECASNPCANGATCIDGVNFYECACVAGYDGVHCDIDVDECSSSPCQNGATCKDHVAGYTCHCVAGWQGVYCELDVNECAPSPCQNGATCNNLLDAYTCTCVAGYEGTNCEIDINECTSYPCQNGATCVDNVNSYTCNCVGDWAGTHCELVHGNWATWNDWSICSVTCANGTVSRTRTCTDPAPVNGGNKCSGVDTEVNTCSFDSCPVDGGWSAWSAYGDCSATCKGGTRTRTRDCTRPSPAWGGAECVGVKFETGECNTNPCNVTPPQDGLWGAWQKWQGCSVTCGSGVQRRYRNCDNPAPDYGGLPCLGEGFEEQKCSDASACPLAVDGQWSAWSTSMCDVTCGNGKVVKQRKCDSPAPKHGGAACPGDNVEVTNCKMANCPANTANSSAFGYGTEYKSKCPKGFFTCKKGKITCIQTEFVCDCSPDCDDSSDEDKTWAGCAMQMKCSSAAGLQTTVLTLLLGVAMWFFTRHW